MGLEIVALTLDFVGKILIAITALSVHTRVRKEQKIDKKVLKEMKFEQSIGVLAIGLIVVAYFLKLYIGY